MNHSPNTADESSLGPFSLKVFVINVTSTPKAAFSRIQGLIGSVCRWEFSMAAVGAEVTRLWFLSSGLVGLFIIILLLSIFLTAICLDCNRSGLQLTPQSQSFTQTVYIDLVKQTCQMKISLSQLR
ncbi:hypothetical protein ILYODFUR_037378 [Ilyodon furcidens]|uniref:Uncharacterized protein n=1 Tax=Ilyodon furcidens TaxID=33524 RepID=A0ABV0V9A7_9TELE